MWSFPGFVTFVTFVTVSQPSHDLGVWLALPRIQCPKMLMSLMFPAAASCRRSMIPG